MRSILMAPAVVAIAGAATGFLLWPLDGNETASAGPKGHNSPDPVDVSPGGYVPIEEAEFAIGMGCDILNLDKVGAILRRELASQNVSRIYGPPLVYLCEEKGNGSWILHAAIETEPKDPSTLVLPADCAGVQNAQTTQPCPPSFGDAGGAAISRGPRIFHIETSGSEVLQ